MAHPWYFCSKRLGTWLSQMNLTSGGQFEIETNYSGVYRGEVESFEVSDILGVKRITVQWRWYMRRGMFFDNNGLRCEKWFHDPPPAFNYKPIVIVDYSWYYMQSNHNRLKIKSRLGEACRFYPPGHPTNIVNSLD